MPATRPVMAYELLPDDVCIVMYKGARAPAVHEWQAYLAFVQSAQHYGDRLKFLVFHQDGSMPREYQTQLTEVMRGRLYKVAVVSPSLLLRFVVSVFVLLNRNIRFFPPDQLDEAHVHLGCDGAASLRLHAALARVRTKVDGSATTGFDAST